MKKKVIFLVLLLIMPSVLADWFYNSESIIANIDIYSDAEIVPITPSGYVESAAVNMTFFPKQTESQELLRLSTTPQAELTDKTLKFTWKNPEGKIDFRLNTDVKTTNSIKKITEKINFPIERLPEGIVQYTKPSETIDSDNKDILRLASKLVEGEDDLYDAAFKIADWTKNNIQYDLSTLTAEVSQKASWVLENRQGVCDELTSLFIALLRAVGIPARFVSGIAYTNSPLFPENWGAHGWAEVYMPGYGWVPFDVTYGEFGWIDPTHIKFKDSIDSDEPSTYYQWLGRNADLKTRKLDIKTSVISSIGQVQIPLSIEAFALKQSVKFGSYNLVEAAVENLNGFYYATELHLTKPKEVKIIGNELKNVLLLPKEKKKIFWAVKLDENLDSRYSYTFPIIVSTLNNISSQTGFTSSIREQYVPLEEVDKAAKLLEEEKEKRYSGNVILDCRTEKSEFYEYENAKIYCGIKNIGNIYLDNVDVCLENKCEGISLGISQEKNVSFEIDESQTGQRESTITLKNNLVSKASYAGFKINDIPKIKIEELEFPVNVSYDENFTINFTLAKSSHSNPKDVEVIFSLNSLEKKWNIEELTENREFSLRFEGTQLENGKNYYKINAAYHDGLKRQYAVDKEFSNELLNADIFQRMFLSLNAVGNFFERAGLAAIALMLLIGAVSFIIVVMIIFRKNKRE